MAAFVKSFVTHRVTSDIGKFRNLKACDWYQIKYFKLSDTTLEMLGKLIIKGMKFTENNEQEICTNIKS
jgi:hypothetical protein